MSFLSYKSLVAFSMLAVLLLWETRAPFFAFPRGSERLIHGFRNVLIGTVNAVITSVAFVGLWLIAADASARHGVGVLHWMMPPGVARGVLAVLLLDLWTYAWHRLSHRVPLLWRFHRVHHSDPFMDVTTANRFHSGEIVISSLLRIPLVYLLGLELEHVAVYELLMFALVQLQHANISIGGRWDHILNWFIVTPFMHKVHHSHWQPETNSNYSSLLSIWDRLFGSYRRSGQPEHLRLGLDEFADAGSQTLAGMLRTPLAPIHGPTVGGRTSGGPHE